MNMRGFIVNLCETPSKLHCLYTTILTHMNSLHVGMKKNWASYAIAQFHMKHI